MDLLTFIYAISQMTLLLYIVILVSFWVESDTYKSRYKNLTEVIKIVDKTKRKESDCTVYLSLHQFFAGHALP